MKISPEILNELRAISPLLAGMEKVNVFQAPEGYFNELHLRITDYAILNNTSPADNINKRNLQQVPEGYFDTLSDSVLAKVKAAYPESAEEELRNLSTLLHALKGENIFSVPQGYFESFAGNLISHLKSENAEDELSNLSPTLYALKNENVFSVPQGYFESLAVNIFKRLESAREESAEEELRILSPMLYAIKGENVFSVPRGYFDSLAKDIVEKVNPQPAKVVTMKRNSWFKYAAAAIVTGVIAVSSLLIFNNNSGKTGEHTTAVSTVLPDYIKASFQYKNEADLNAGIAKLSDDDIIKYLEENGNIMDNELLTNNTDVSEMPSQTDYLSDEDALNKYLDKIDAETDKKTKL